MDSKMDYEVPRLIKFNEFDDLAQGVLCSTGTGAGAGDGCSIGNSAVGAGCYDGNTPNKCTIGGSN
jgi:hypothetical protein